MSSWEISWHQSKVLNPEQLILWINSPFEKGKKRRKKPRIISFCFLYLSYTFGKDESCILSYYKFLIVFNFKEQNKYIFGF